MLVKTGAWAGDVVVLVGDPVIGSQAKRVAAVVGEGLAAGGREPRIIELAEAGTSLLQAADERVGGWRETVSRARVLVVATPVYQAGYTGVLKVFLDGLDATALESTIAVPVVLSASPAHGALADLQLRTVLQAAGAMLPIPSFVLEEHHLDALPHYVAAWVDRFATAITLTADSLRLEEAAAR